MLVLLVVELVAPLPDEEPDWLRSTPVPSTSSVIGVSPAALAGTSNAPTTVSKRRGFRTSHPLTSGGRHAPAPTLVQLHLVVPVPVSSSAAVTSACSEWPSIRLVVGIRLPEPNRYAERPVTEYRPAPCLISSPLRLTVIVRVHAPVGAGVARQLPPSVPPSSLWNSFEVLNSFVLFIRPASTPGDPMPGGTSVGLSR